MIDVQIAATPQQELGFCRSADGTRIAWARHGSGPVLVIAACWLSHLQFDWQSPVWRHYLAEMGRFATIVRYDERGHGLSDRDITDHSLENRIADLEAVIADAGLDRFALMGMAQGGPVTIAYASQHPERVSRLLLYGTYSGALHSMSEEDLELDSAFEQMIKVGWARPDSAFRRVFTSMMIPEATEEQMTWLDELQRVAVDADIAVTSRRQRKLADTTELLPDLDVPTLVLHSRGDRMNGFDEGRHLAAEIPGARLVALESSNHIVLADEPAWPMFRDEVAAFLEPDRATSPTSALASPVSLLSPRELDVLRLVAEGRANEEIAETLVISARTVERHLQNTYAKLDVRGKSARAAAVARLFTSA